MNLRAQRTRQKQDVKNISINGELLERFNKLRMLESHRLGFKITIKQFMTIIITQIESKNGFSHIPSRLPYSGEQK
tara:strand:- start:221 stop:448 length:228 start_codon:yes stop_codon:yes gene_type:complete